jgi:hypothetical protein
VVITFAEIGIFADYGRSVSKRRQLSLAKNHCCNEVYDQIIRRNIVSGVCKSRVTISRGAAAISFHFEPTSSCIKITFLEDGKQPTNVQPGSCRWESLLTPYQSSIVSSSWHQTIPFAAAIRS